MYIRTSELRQLDVVNVEDGSIVGNVCDVDVDPDTGRLRSLILDRPSGRFFRFLRHDDLELPWEEVILVGIDVVLIRAKSEKNSKHQTWHGRKI